MRKFIAVVILGSLLCSAGCFGSPEDSEVKAYREAVAAHKLMPPGATKEAEGKRLQAWKLDLETRQKKATDKENTVWDWVIVGAEVLGLGGLVESARRRRNRQAEERLAAIAAAG